MDYIRRLLISIHALFAEGDVQGAAMCGTDYMDFYPRPLRRGRRVPLRLVVDRDRFLSTPSSQRATVVIIHYGAPAIISIHALFAEGDLVVCIFTPLRIISIHALFAEGDFSIHQ